MKPLLFTAILFLSGCFGDYRDEEIKYYNVYCREQLMVKLATNPVEHIDHFTIEKRSEILFNSKYPKPQCTFKYILSIWR